MSKVYMRHFKKSMNKKEGVDSGAGNAHFNADSNVFCTVIVKI